VKTTGQRIIVIFLVSVLVSVFVLSVYYSSSQQESTIPWYTYRIVNTYPHDPQAFTQGLVFHGGYLYESTGLYNFSTIRRVELETGSILQIKHLSHQYFGEGMTIFTDSIIQLTWKSNVGFVYDVHSFKLLQNFSFPNEGWGLTHDGDQLIMSDGTEILSFLDPETFEKIGELYVQNNESISGINELEYIQGELFANIWKTDYIARIDLETGQVIGWIDLSGLPDAYADDHNDVLNGIAYDAQSDRFFVTGKHWSNLYEIQIIPK
jgi:glutamine cyclotransferase